MAIVINGSGTVTGLAVGGLPDGTVDAGTLATNSVDSAELIDGAVDASHLASGAATDATKLPLAGGTLTGDLNFGDNVDANFGAGADLKIYHDGSDSIIHDTGTGDLYLKGSAEVLIRSATNENMIKAVADGAVNLYHNNAKKIETTSIGVSVTGRINVSDGIAIADGAHEQLFIVTGSSQEHDLIRLDNTLANSDNHIIQRFNRNGSLTGSIRQTNNATSYVTSSDYRLKENVDYTWDATTRLKQLKPARFNFIADDTNTLVDGFIAHEVSSVVPEAIGGAKDAMQVETRYTADDVETQGDSPSKAVGDVKTYSSSIIEPQGIDQSKLVPLLVKTIQELEARITALEA